MALIHTGRKQTEIIALHSYQFKQEHITWSSPGYFEWQKHFFKQFLDFFFQLQKGFYKLCKETEFIQGKAEVFSFLWAFRSNYKERRSIQLYILFSQ